MLYYRGLSQISDWDWNDKNQILRGLDVCKMASETAKSRILRKEFLPKSLKGLEDDEATYIEWYLYGVAISVIRDFVKSLGPHIAHFDNPPISFSVKDKTVTLYPSRVFDPKTKKFGVSYFHKEIAMDILKKLKEEGYKVEVSDEFLRLEDESMERRPEQGY